VRVSAQGLAPVSGSWHPSFVRPVLAAYQHRHNLEHAAVCMDSSWMQIPHFKAPQANPHCPVLTTAPTHPTAHACLNHNPHCSPNPPPPPPRWCRT
jgi:hypothetical protein